VREKLALGAQVSANTVGVGDVEEEDEDEEEAEE
jgi:hypothetical protein